jgi:hypothetical protein
MLFYPAALPLSGQTLAAELYLRFGAVAVPAAGPCVTSACQLVHRSRYPPNGKAIGTVINA